MTAPAGERPMRDRPQFIHLKVHSAYSLLEGALPIARLAKLAAKQGFPALGLTDTNNLFGVLEFSDKMAHAGIQPIAGVALAVDFEDRKPAPLGGGTPAQRQVRNRDGVIALFAMDEAGYLNLLQLVSRAHLGSSDSDGPHVKLADLGLRGEGLIALTGGPDGPIDRALREGQIGLGRARVEALRRMFCDRLYVEVQRHGLSSESTVEPTLLALAYDLELPIVATNEAYFAEPDDYEAHDALLCIADGSYLVDDNRRRLSREHYLKSAEEMAVLFADLPEALDNTVEIARRCVFRPKGRKPILPSYVETKDGASAKERLAAEAAELRRQAEQGLELRLRAMPLAPGFSRKDYDERLGFELDIITRMKFPGYFLIVADFIKWAKAQGIPVGPGRGSGAGSLVAWSLTITDLDPLRFGLLFERFLNPERISMPDFDIDFCQNRRDEVIRYVQDKYGHDRVAQIITHGTLQARAVLRDVGRVLQIPYGQIDRLAKLVPNNPANPVSLKEAIAGEPKLQQARADDPMVARLLEIAIKLEGLYRHASTHAAGLVIADRPLVELVPLYRDPKSNMPVTQFNWKMVEAAGLVKFDFLGLKTLTVLKKAVDLIAKGRGIALDLAMLPLDDKLTYQLLAKADTIGVFQLESTGMRESLKRLKPDRFEDIMAMTALYRPGPMDNIPTYINRKHGEEPVDCLHPMLEPILKETYGVIIYQEQVLQIAQVMAGYTLGQADILRKAMGKKDKSIMAKQQAEFVAGAVRNGVSKNDASYIFELVDKFAGYGFNKAHTAAYAHVAYYTAYLKAHFREEFLAASMTLDMGNTDKLSLFAAEATRSGIDVKPPCINASAVEFAAEPGTPEQPGAIRYSLAALRNIGAGAVEAIVAERDAGGNFKNLSEFAKRMNTKAINKRALETLAAAGAFDALESNRALIYSNADSMFALANRLAEDEAVGTEDLFAAGTGKTQGPTIDLRPVKPWTPMELLEKEFEAVGFYLSGHPLDAYESVLGSLGVKRRAEFEAEAERGGASGRLAAIVVGARERKSQKGNKFAFAMFSDTAGQFEAVIFSDTLSACRSLLEIGTPVLLTVSAERDGDSMKMRVEALEALDKAAGAVQRGVRIRLDAQMLQNGKQASMLEALRSQLKPGGKSEVRLVVTLAEAGREVEIALPRTFDLSPIQRGQISVLPGVTELVEM
jgi:DNA polymerase-3 subunit alpha